MMPVVQQVHQRAKQQKAVRQVAKGVLPMLPRHEERDDQRR